MSVSPVLDSCDNPAILMFQKSFQNREGCFETRVLFRNLGVGGGGGGGRVLANILKSCYPPPLPHRHASMKYEYGCVDRLSCG